MRAVLFDLDGTLLDTLADLAGAANAVLADWGLAGHPAAAYRRFVGDGVEALMRRALPPDRRDPADVDRAVRRVREEYGRRWDRTTRPYPGIPEMLTELTSRRIPCAVLSNKPHDFTTRMVAHFFPRQEWAAVAGARPDWPRKPDPAAALDLARALGAPPDQILYLGDSDTDMRTARNAGMVPAGALWGFRDEAELRAGGARHLLAHPRDLPALL